MKKGHVAAAHVLNLTACAAENPFYPLMITDEPNDAPTSSSNPPCSLPQLHVIAPDRDPTALDVFKLPWSNPGNFQQYHAPLLQPNELSVLLPEPWTSELAKLGLTHVTRHAVRGDNNSHQDP
jgi:hypothetical protein